MTSAQIVGALVIFNDQRYLRERPLRGTLAFTANGKRVTRAFSVKV